MKLKGNISKLAKRIGQELDLDGELYPAMAEVGEGSEYGYDKRDMQELFLLYGSTKYTAEELSDYIYSLFNQALQNLGDYVWEEMGMELPEDMLDDDAVVMKYMEMAFEEISTKSNRNWNWKNTYKTIEKYYSKMFDELDHSLENWQY